MISLPVMDRFEPLLPHLKGEELSDNIRAAIITAHGLCGLSFQQIQDQSEGRIQRKSASRVWHHTNTSAQIALSTTAELDWYTLLEYTRDLARSGRPKALSATKKSKLRSGYLDDPSAPFAEVSQRQGLSISETTNRRVANSASPEHPKRILKRKRPHKLVLSAIDVENRRIYCNWLKERLVAPKGYIIPRKALFVMSDETPIYIGGPPRHNEFVSAYQGTPAHAIAKRVSGHPKFTLQLLASCCSDFTVQRPCMVFVKEDKQQKSEIQHQIDQSHALAKEKAQKQIQEASDLNSAAAKAVDQANKVQATRHVADLASGKKVARNKRALRPEQVFRVQEKDFKRTAEKGMDFAWYAYNWLIPELYPYYWKVSQNNPDCDVYLIEDNSSAHKRAREHLCDHQLQQGILFAPQPGNSPDLHPIETCFSALKDQLDNYQPAGSSKKDRQLAKEAVLWQWQNAESFESHIEAECSNQAFIHRMRLCIKSNYWNNFHA